MCSELSSCVLNDTRASEHEATLFAVICVLVQKGKAWHSIGRVPCSLGPPSLCRCAVQDLRAHQRTTTNTHTTTKPTNVPTNRDFDYGTLSFIARAPVGQPWPSRHVLRSRSSAQAVKTRKRTKSSLFPQVISRISTAEIPHGTCDYRHRLSAVSLPHQQSR